MVVLGSIIESAPLVMIIIFYETSSRTIRLIRFLVLSNGNSASTVYFSNFLRYSISILMLSLVFSTNLKPTSADPWTSASSSGEAAYMTCLPVCLSVSRTTVWHTAISLKNSWHALIVNCSFSDLLADRSKVRCASTRLGNI